MKDKRSEPKGFTLIEVLVVIAIIAILAAILFPVFAKARARGKQASCESNARQIMSALLQYKEEHNGWIPFPYLKSGNTYNHTWRRAIYRYVRNDNLFRCPSNRDVRSYIYTAATQPATPSDVARSGYGMWKGMEPPTAGMVFFPVDTSVWATPAQGIVIGENGGSSVLSVEPTETRVEMKPRFDHFDGMVVGYGDGHVRRYHKDSAELQPSAFGNFGWAEHMQSY